jgi:predicted transposase/invertase (TIGR01784 family)
MYIPSFRYYKVAENEFSKETLLGVKNVLSAIFFLENSDMSDVSGDIKNIVSLIDRERPEELRLFRKWIKHFFYGNDEISDEIETGIKEIEEVKDMLSTTLKKRDKIQYQQGLERGREQGMYKKAVDTAKALLDENMSIKKISSITSLPVEEIEKLK